MGVITDDMRRVIESTRLAFVATVNPDGTPNLSPKSSLAVLDDNRIGFADIASPNTVRNLKANPAIEVNAIDIFMRRGYRFRGTATLEPPGSEIFAMIAEPFWAENGRDFPIHGVVNIAVEKALPVLSPAYTFIEGVTEEALREAYYRKYGVGAGDPLTLTLSPAGRGDFVGLRSSAPLPLAGGAGGGWARD